MRERNRSAAAGRSCGGYERPFDSASKKARAREALCVTPTAFARLMEGDPSTPRPGGRSAQDDKGGCAFARTPASTATRSVLAAFAIVLLMLAWVAFPMLGHPATASAADKDKPIVVSMGDSYSAGEGTEPFFDQQRGDDKYKSEDFLAHRSEKAWPGQLVVNGTRLNTMKDDGWYFTAVSGAETNHILKDEQSKDWQKEKKGYVTTTKLPVQLDIFKEKDLAGKVDYVTMSIGGNDVGFSKVVSAACTDDVPFVGSGDLDAELRAAIKKFDSTTRYDLEKVYAEVGKAAGEQAYIIVAGYPHLFPKEGRSALVFDTWFGPSDLFGAAKVDKTEAKNINDSVDVFCAGIKEVIAKAPQDNLTFVDVRPYFDGHEAEYINPPYNYTNAQDLMIQYPNKKDKEVSAYSVHPNEQGQEAYRKAVQNKIDYLEKNIEKGQTLKQNVDIPSQLLMSLVFDVSGSMDDASALSGSTKLASAKKQSTDFVSSVSRQGGVGGMSVKVGVASFASSAETNCGLSNDPDEINDSINGLIANGRTNMYDGLNEGIVQLQSDANEGDSKKLLVFLSDGLSNEGKSRSEIVNLAHQAADKGIVIYTIGFGQSGDLDEELLKEIADITGGKYSHEDSADLKSAAVGLFATMMRAAAEGSSQVILDETGSVSQGETVNVGTFDVPANGTVQAFLYWPGSTLGLHLTDPDGVKVDEGYKGVVIDASSIPVAITIENAKKGSWNVDVSGDDVSMAQEPFFSLVTFVETEEVQQAISAGGGGGASNNAEGLLFLVFAIAVGCLVAVFALARRGARK